MSNKTNQNEDSKETITEETNDTESTDSAPIEETKSSTDTPIETKLEEAKPTDLSVMIAEIQKLQKNYTETLKELKAELVDTKAELTKFQEETKAKEPLKITAVVKGKADFTKKIAELGLKNEQAYQQHCRAIYDRINNTYPTINRLS